MSLLAIIIILLIITITSKIIWRLENDIQSHILFLMRSIFIIALIILIVLIRQITLYWMLLIKLDIFTWKYILI